MRILHLHIEEVKKELKKQLEKINLSEEDVIHFKNDFFNNELYNDVPGLESVLSNYPNAIVSLVLFVVLILVGLPLCLLIKDFNILNINYMFI